MVFKIKKILVPLDGSSNSFRGLDVAIHLANSSFGKPITNKGIVSLISNL